MKRNNSSTIELLEAEGLLPDDEKEIIEYGLHQLKIYLSSITITILLGLLFGLFTESIIFLFAIIPLRMYAGGYHADSPIRCYITSSIILLVTFCFIKYFDLHSITYIKLSSLSTAVIFFLAPVENSTRRLEEIEKLIFKKRTRIIATILYIITIISCFLNFNKVMEPVLAASIIVSFSLLTGHIKYKEKK